MEVALIGGGIGGLVAALYLHRQGIPCRVYEAHPEYKPLGVGVNFLPHAVRRLTQLGLQEKLAALCVAPKEFVWFNRHGQLIYREPCGVLAGYAVPHFSIHRADLHRVCYEAVCERLGKDAVVMGHVFTGLQQDERGVTLNFSEFGSRRDLPPGRAAVAVGCDGFRSVVRRQFYPAERDAAFGGVNMWRGVSVGKPFLSGASVVRAGPLDPGKMVLYPIRNHADGTQLMNFAFEVKKDECIANDWNQPGRLEDFLPIFEDWHFDWCDVPDLLRRAEFILEYPMVDRDPIDRWTFGRVTLLGDAAHPMYPRGGNGAAQAIIDAERLAAHLKANADWPAALENYQDERLPKTSKIVLTNRSTPPDFIIETVEMRTKGQPFQDIREVMSEAEMADISEKYKRVASFDLQSVNE